MPLMSSALLRKKKFLKGDFPFLILLLILSIFISWPLFNEDFINTVDGGDHLLHIYCMNQFIGHGQWFVRWVPHLYGYGYPVFNYYPPFFALLGTAFLKTGLSIVWALNLACFMIVVFSGFSMYFFAKELWGSEGGFLSAVAYIFAPYFMLDLYVRGAYAELASFVFLPLILWAFLRLHKEPNINRLIIASLSLAGLFLTHNCVTLIFCPIVLLYILVLHLPINRQNLASIIFSLLAFFLGIALTAFFWLPAYLEKDFVHIERILNGALDFHQNFLSVQQLLYAPWPQKAGTPLPYEIGPLHCLLALISFCFILKISQGNRSLFKQWLFLFVILIGIIFLTLPLSINIWEHIHILKFIQFPSRLLVVVTLLVSILAGSSCLLFNPKHRIIVMILAVLAIILVNSNRCHPPYGSVKVNLKGVSSSIVFSHLHPQDGGEFIPKWVKEKRIPIPLEKLQIIQGHGRIIKEVVLSEVHQIFYVEVSTPSILCLNVFYFPGWDVKVDGKSVEIFKDNPYGLIVFSIKEGVHEIKADFGPTPIRQTATNISFIALLFLIALFIFGTLIYNKNLRQ